MIRLVMAMMSLAILAGGSGTAAADDLSLTDVQRLIEERGYSWTAGHTGVSDLPPAVKRDLAGLVIPPDAALLEADLPVLTAPQDVVLPERWDWRESVPGVHPIGVTPVKNQGTCASCWAFAAAAQLESHVRIADGVVEDLSEQQLVSCNHQGGSCAGGWHLHAYTVFTAPGAVAEACFPYENTDVPCDHWDCSAVARIDGYCRVANDTMSIKHALMTGPLFVGIRWQEMFAFYQRGVYDVPADEQRTLPVTNHAVLLVGWDDTIEHGSGTGAWIVKNSWGDEWGMEGYAYVSYESAFLNSGPRQLVYLPDSSGRLVLDEPQDGQTWVARTNQTVSWITDLAADHFEVGFVVDGQYQMVAAAIPGSATHYDLEAPDIRAQALAVRVTALTAEGMVLAIAESTAPIYLVHQRVTWPTDGVTVTAGADSQRPFALVADGEGGCVLFWRGDEGNLVARMSALGVPVWSGPRQLPTVSTVFSCLGDGAGGAYFAYSTVSGGGHQVRLVRITADGTLPWGSSGIRVDSPSAEYPYGHSICPCLASDGDGGVVCAWNFYDVSFETVYGQRLAADGTKLWDTDGAPGLRLTGRSGAGPCTATRVAGDAVAIAYFCFGDGTYDRTDLWVQLVSDTGERPWGDEGRRARAGVGQTTDHALSPDPLGGVALLWRESGDGWSQVHLQRYTADGAAIWGDGGLVVDRLEVAGRLQPRLVADETGGHLITVAKQSSLAEFDVAVHRFGPDGNRLWPAAGVPLVSKAGLIGYPGVDAPLVADGAGGAIVFWAEFDPDVSGGLVGVTAQRVGADGTAAWTPFGEPVVLSHGVPVRTPVVCRDRGGSVSLAWGYDFDTPSVHLQRLAGDFTAPPGCEVTAWLRRDDELLPVAGNVVRGCPDGDADALVIVCDFADADLEGAPLVSPADVALDTSELGISLGSTTAADVAGTPDNGYCVTLVRDLVLGCSGCAGDGCDEGTVAAGPLTVTYQGLVIGAVPDVVVHGFDVNGDGAVNLVELVGLAGTYGRQNGDPGFDGCFDASGDDRVNLTDWTLLVPHYGAPTGAEPAAATVTLRLVGAGTARTYEVVLQGGGARAAVLRFAGQGVAAATPAWRADSPAAKDAVLLPAMRDGRRETWLVLPWLDRASGTETTLGRLTLPARSAIGDAFDILRLVGGEAMLDDGSIASLVHTDALARTGGAVALAAPFPNPCNPSVTITFTAPRAERLALRIYDITGRLVRTLVEETAPGSAEPRQVTWTGRDEGGRAVASGIYFVRLATDGAATTRRLVLIR